MPTETQKLLTEIEAFLAKFEMADSTFGRKSVNDGKLVARLREGSSVTLNTAARIREYMRVAITPAAKPAPSLAEAAS